MLHGKHFQPGVLYQKLKRKTPKKRRKERQNPPKKSSVTFSKPEHWDPFTDILIGADSGGNGGGNGGGN